MKSLNLASRPFESERLPGLLTGLALLAALAVSAVHVSEVRRLRGAQVDRGELTAKERDLRELYRREHRARPQDPDPELLARWAAIKELIDRRSFSWGGLLSDLERLLPRDLRLISINPSLEDGTTQLELRAVARGRAEGYEFVRVLQESGRFTGAMPLSVAAAAVGEDFVYRMRYEAQPHRKGTP